MTYFPYADNDFYTLIKLYNPLHLRDNGVLRIFKDYTEAYLSWFEYLREHYPRGYIEFGHYFRIVIGLSANEESNFYNYCHNRHGAAPFCLVNWSQLSTSDLKDLQYFTMSVQLYYETTFHLDLFKEAFKIFIDNESKNS